VLSWPTESADGLDQTYRLKIVHPCVVEMQSLSYLSGRLCCWSNLLEISGDLGVSPTKRREVRPRTSAYHEGSMIALDKIADKFARMGEKVCN